MLPILLILGLAIQHPEEMSMKMTDPLGISMERMGSGTTWIPDAVPLPARHVMAGSWLLMLHGFGFVQYDKQGGPRGDDQFGSLNWAMLMASRDLLGGRFQARTMLSLDPATVSNRRALRRAGARPRCLHAPAIGHGQSGRAVVASLAGRDAYQFRRFNRRPLRTTLETGGFCLQRPRA